MIGKKLVCANIKKWTKKILWRIFLILIQDLNCFFYIEHYVAHYAQWLVVVLLQGKKKEPRKINSLICKIQIIFSGFGNDLFNMFDIDFLLDFNGKIHYHLKQLFDMTKKVFVYFSTKICVQYAKLVFR